VGPLAEREMSNVIVFPAQLALLGDSVLATAFPASEKARPGVSLLRRLLSVRSKSDSFAALFSPGLGAFHRGM